MQFHKNRILRYLDIVIAVIIGFILIKLINNYNVFFSFVSKFFSIISPFIFAMIIAYILNPIMNFLERKFKLKRSLSILITYSLIIFIIAIFLIYLMPKITSSIIDIGKNIPEVATKSQNWINNFIQKHGLQDYIVNSMGDFNLKPDFLVSKASTILVNVLNTLLSKTLSFTNSFIKWIFGFIISIYVLADKERIIDFFKKIIYIVFKNKNGTRIMTFFKNIHYMIGIYIGTKALDSLIIAIIAFVGLNILKSPYTLLIALIVGVTNMIPYFGPFVGMVAAFIINIFFSPLKALFVLIFLFLLQQFDGWYLDPKLIGGKVGLNPFLIIFAVTVGGGFYGAIGMLLAVPTMAVIKIYVDKLMLKYNDIINDRVYSKDINNEEK
ncbi:AI-2E family transporter [Clostridium rectalis]|uniref:AI-2E family transporter n=1 Tax=Clostridium rectalis TaxID=2040295 RepID=UPI000F62E52E|nr:AI-2E family transporter [Clostridium rectalis]